MRIEPEQNQAPPPPCEICDTYHPESPSYNWSHPPLEEQSKALLRLYPSLFCRTVRLVNQTLRQESDEVKRIVLQGTAAQLWQTLDHPDR